MVKPRTLYHATFADALDSITEKGLLPSEDPHWGGDLGEKSYGKVFFGKTPSDALYYARILFRDRLERQGQSAIPLVLRAAVSPEMVRSAKKSFERKRWTEERIPPELLDVYWHGWRPVQDEKNRQLGWSDMDVRWQDDYDGYADWEGGFLGKTPRDAWAEIARSITPRGGGRRSRRTAPA